MEHLAEQRVLDLVRGALAEPLLRDVHAHLDSCDECRAVVASVLRGDATEPALGRGSPDPEGPTIPEGPRARRSPVALPATRVEEYELLELVGRGGMGTVYRARDTLLDREVAIKLLERTGSELARQRFLVEARAVARIRHPNVVVVHRVGLAGDQPYIVYDLVRGRTFAELRTPLPWPKVLELAVGVARGLATAHACGVLHRDLKPANVMLDEHDEVVLVDFGLAKLDDRGDLDRAGEAVPQLTSSAQMTATGVAMGTPRYMSPESWRGGVTTPQTDLYSFGLVIYELLAGRLPFADTSAAELPALVCERDPPPLQQIAPWIPPTLAALVDRCVARAPAARPLSASAVADELEAMQRGRAFETFERDRVRRAPEGNPYPGARAFGFEHQGVFFGRGDELRAIVDVLRARPFVVIAGEAGAGKTSLCLAGLFPILARGALGGARKWIPVVVVPGAHPMTALAAAIAPHVVRPPAEVARLLEEQPEKIIAELRAGHGSGCSAHVLFVDQLEDLVTTAERAEACRFAAILARLAEPSPALRVVATLQMSHMMAVAGLPGLAPVIGPALYLLLEPREERALREIVVEPARLGGRTLGEEVAQTLIAAAARGELPLRDLGHRLAALWDTGLGPERANDG